MPKYLYLAVTKDKYEFPLFISDTAQGLAKRYGVTDATVISSISRYENGELDFSRYRRVRIDEDEEICTTKEKTIST